MMISDAEGLKLYLNSVPPKRTKCISEKIVNNIRLLVDIIDYANHEKLQNHHVQTQSYLLFCEDLIW